MAKYTVYFIDNYGQGAVDFDNKEEVITFTNGLMEDPTVEEIWVEDNEIEDLDIWEDLEEEQDDLDYENSEDWEEFLENLDYGDDD